MHFESEQNAGNGFSQSPKISLAICMYSADFLHITVDKLHCAVNVPRMQEMASQSSKFLRPRGGGLLIGFQPGKSLLIPSPPPIFQIFLRLW